MDKSFVVLERLIYATNIRNKVLASNIANTDTPDYRARDIDFKSIIDGELTEMSTTDPRHIKMNPALNAPSPAAGVDQASWGDGNNVELDMEVAKMTENGLLYEAGVRLLSAKIRMFRSAVQGR